MEVCFFFINYVIRVRNKLKNKIILILLVLIVLSSCRNSEPEVGNRIVEDEVGVEKDSIEEFPEMVKEEVAKIEIINNASEKIKPFKFTEGLYLSAYSVVSSRFPAILDSAQAAGINTIVFDLKNMSGDVFFSVPQKGSYGRERYKTIINIPRVVKTLHDRNMRAVSRIVMFHDQFLASADSTLRPQNVDMTSWKESKRRKASWLDSSNHRVQADLLYLIEQAASGGVDEVQLDYVRFPTGGDLKNAVFQFMQDDFTAAKADSNYVMRAKPDVVEDFVGRAKEICSRYDVTLAADVFAIVAWQNRVDVANTGQDIARMTKHLDMIHPMIYSSHFADDFGYRTDVPNEPYFIMYKGTMLTKKYSDDRCRVVPYIQANRWKVDYSAEYVYAQIEAIKAAGGDGYILWNASCKYNNTLRWIKKYD